MTRRRVLVLGGTGAMGVYLVPQLLEHGYGVDVTSRSDRASENDNLHYIKGDAHDTSFLADILKSGSYDAIVDFMGYQTDEFRARHNLLVHSCQHYVFISSYRVFADSDIITENSPRLLDVSNDTEYLATDDYALTKARQEDMLRSSNLKNWTIIRPAITYSQTRFQLATMEADTLLWRGLQNLPVVIPKAMMGKTTTLTWAGDVARIISKLVLNKDAYGEDYNVATHEHHTWREVANIYSEVLGLKVVEVEVDEYIEAMGGGHVSYQVWYDRMFNRKLDCSKVLAITGENADGFMKLEDGLRQELKKYVKSPVYSREINYARQAKFDKLTNTRVDLGSASEADRIVYESIVSPQPGADDKKQSLRGQLRIRTRLRHVSGQIRMKVRIRTRLGGVKARLFRLYQSLEVRKIDGAIVTLTGYFNYGNIIQRYALQEYLRHKGYKFVSYAREPLQLGGEDARKFKHTANFINRQIWRRPYNPEDKLPVYIVGSDQVWRNWETPKKQGDLLYYFLDFLGDRSAKRISYAASFGVDNLKDALIDSALTDAIRPLINRFDAISMRESSGVDILKHVWGKRSALVVDPTMLLTKSHYSSIIASSSSKLHPTRGVFSYMLKISDEKRRLIEKIATDYSTQAEVIHPKELEVMPAVEQWLQGFRDSDFVITDSFHGTVFSIINNTPFIVIENEYGGIARITTLLEAFGLADRVIKEKDADKFNIDCLKPVDWEKINKLLKKARKDSGKWIVNAIEGNMS